MQWFNRWRRPRTDLVTPSHTAPESEDFAWLDNRRHLADSPYALPKDVQETNRLDFQHYLFRQAFKGDFIAPIQAPESILDVGTGTGRWAVEMALRFPNANVIGLDITPASPEASAQQEQRPENYVFVKGNVLEGLPFGDGSFDFVHMRLLFSAIPAERWPDVVRELARVTRSGGWVESVEATGLRDGSPVMMQMAGWFAELFRRRGIDQNIAPRIPDFMHAAGLLRVYTREALIPLGKHGGRIGTMMATDGMALMQALRGAVVAQGLTSAETYDAMITQVRADFDTWPAVQPNYLTYGQRPPR